MFKGIFNPRAVAAMKEQEKQKSGYAYKPSVASQSMGVKPLPTPGNGMKMSHPNLGSPGMSNGLHEVKPVTAQTVEKTAGPMAIMKPKANFFAIKKKLGF